MGQLEQFIINHWALWLGLLIILVLILVNEIISQKNRTQEISPPTAVSLINDKNAVVLDLRDAESFHKGHIINAIRANPDDFTSKKMDKYKDKPLILVCARGLQSASLAAKLRNQGFNQLVILAGGVTAWQNADLPLVKGK